MGNIHKNSDLRHITRKRISLKERTVLFYMPIVFEILCIFMDICGEKRRIYSYIGRIFKEENFDLYCKIIYSKCLLGANIDRFFDIIITLDTILAASVIFFYSVQDNRKGGIPHRVIMSYAYGSFLLPCMFIVILLLVPINFGAISLNLRWTAWFGMLYTYIVQMRIIVIILKSTSYQVSVNILGNAEIRQYDAICCMENENIQDMERKNHVAENPLFRQTYLQHHFGQVVLSNELSSDKLELMRRLLRIPYYEGEIKLMKEHMFCKTAMKKQSLTGWKSKKGFPEISFRKLGENSLANIYEFYYENLLMVLNQDKKEYIDERNRIYFVIYEFIEELSKLREINKGIPMSCDTAEKCCCNYLMTICGILNAVMDSNVEEAESVCHYVLNNIVCKDVWNLQVGLYIFFQEYLVHINRAAIKLDALNRMRELENWKLLNDDRCKEDTEKLYQEFWQVWMQYTTLSKKVINIHFINAYRTLNGETYLSEPISYFLYIIQRKRENMEYEGTNNRINK